MDRTPGWYKRRVAPPRHPPAWYPDPEHPDRIRRWNGRAWTDDVRPLPAWVRTVRLAPGPPARVRHPSRRLWATSAACLLAGALVMLLLGRGTGTDPDRLGDRAFARAADVRCAETRRALPERTGRRSTASELRALEGRTAAWERMVDDLRELPVAGADTALVDAWLRSWDRWTALQHDYVEAIEDGDEAEANRIVVAAQTPHALITRFALVNGMNDCVFR